MAYSVIFKGLASETLTMLQKVYDQHKLDLVKSCLFLFWMATKVDLGGLGRQYDWLYCIKFPSNQFLPHWKKITMNFNLQKYSFKAGQGFTF